MVPPLSQLGRMALISFLLHGWKTQWGLLDLTSIILCVLRGIWFIFMMSLKSLAPEKSLS